MNTIRQRLLLLPIKWKIVLWSSCLLVLLYIFYNVVQYAMINRWLYKQEEVAITKNMNELLGYFQEKNTSFTGDELIRIRFYLDRISQNYQLIRVLDRGGTPILTVEHGLPAHWIDPKPVESRETVTTHYYENRLLLVRSPLATEQFTGTIEIANHLVSTEKLTRLMLFIMLGGGVAAVVLSGAAGYMLADWFLRPLRLLAETMRSIKQRGLQERVQVVENRDELSVLTSMFNDMMDQLEQAFLRQQQFVEDASHELRTPISIIEGHLSLLQRWGKQDPVILEESLNASLQESRRLQHLVQELLDLSRAEAIDLSDAEEASDPSQTILATVRNVSILHPDFRFETALSGLEGTAVAMAPHHLEQVLLILIDNAVKYSQREKKIGVHGTIADGMVKLDVIDRGIGIPAAELPYVGHRFYRVDKARSRKQGGSGLGLSIAKRIVERYRGALAIASEEGTGTTVTVRLPAVPEG
ncbi:ATP-binding protein [Paenibacillus sp. MBLB4367]|uniref:HAMP domain-containing sensor histidine kinase n=1 Tax=Paenibacillus sp. MBLB4367 TaxID=3384767 RepID=UPI00390825C8